MNIETFFDKDTFTLTYIVYDAESKEAAIIDPVYDYEPHASNLSEDSIKKVTDFISTHSLRPVYILETHAHADHLTGSQKLKEIYPEAKVGIGKYITKVQEKFKGVFNLKELAVDGSQFDLLLDEKDILKIGKYELKTIHTPGHTPACVSYLIEDAIFTGDALFMPDFGTGRCDFPAGSAEDLYTSVHEKLYKLPDETRVFVGHDYQPNGRELEFQTTIGESKEKNIQLTQATSREEYVEFRTTRDAKLKAPKLLLQSIQINIDAGKLPEAEDNGMRYLKFPIK